MDENLVNENLNYIGEGDDQVSFHGGAKCFLTESRSNIRFGFKLENKTTATRVIALAFGDFPTAASVNSYTGETVDGLLTDGNIVTDGVTFCTATAANSKLKIAHLQRFVAKNPSTVTEITLQANSEEAWKEKITIIKANPFYPAKTEYIDLQDFLDQYQQQAKKITIPIAKIFPDFQMDDQAVILLPIGGTNVLAGGISLQVTMGFGGILNHAATLNTKRKKAIANGTRLVNARRAMGR